jgi:hypothetical protein
MASGRELGMAAVVSAILLAANAAYVSATLGFIHKPRRVLETDHYHYIAMAEAPPWHEPVKGSLEAPFCYRLFAPTMALLLARTGLGLNSAFYLLTNGFLFAFLVAFFALLRCRGATLSEALAGLTIVAMVPGAIRWYEYQYWMPDPPCLFFATLAILWIRSGRRRPLLFLGPLAVTARESYLLALPYDLVVNTCRMESPRKALIRSAQVAAGPLVVLLLLHWAITPESGWGPLAAAREMVAFRLRHLWDGQLYFATLGSFGVLFPLALLRPEAALRFLRTTPEDAVLVAATYATLAFANNTDRLLAYALPAVVPAALVNLRLVAIRAGVGFAPCALTAVAVQALMYVRTPFHVPGASIYQPTSLLMVSVLAALWLAGRALLRGSADR